MYRTNTLKENNHKLLSEYVNTMTKVLIDFNCGHIPHWISPDNYKSGCGCPKCKNKGEAKLYKLLIDKNRYLISLYFFIVLAEKKKYCRSYSSSQKCFFYFQF